MLLGYSDASLSGVLKPLRRSNPMRSPADFYPKSSAVLLTRSMNLKVPLVLTLSC